MTTNEMITELTQTVRHLQNDVETLKKDKDYLYSKLEKAYDDRIALRAENTRLKIHQSMWKIQKKKNVSPARLKRRDK